MKRSVAHELLDELPANDPRAMHSRRDLQRVNAWMGHGRIMARMLANNFDGRPRSIVDLGGGDGTLLLRIAKRLAPQWKNVHGVIVDRQALLSPSTQAQFETLSWHVEFHQADLFDWLRRPDQENNDVLIANLFLHHFQEHDLREVLRYVAHQTQFFLACEPRRDNLALSGAKLLRFIGCNDVTRHDAKISVQAGFVESELSALWPVRHGWRLLEREVGLFSHCFVARNSDGRTS